MISISRLIKMYLGDKFDYYLEREIIHLIQNVGPELYAVPSIGDIVFDYDPASEPVITFQDIIDITDEVLQVTTTIYILDKDDLFLYLLNTDEDMSFLIHQPDNPTYQLLVIAIKAGQMTGYMD